MQYRFVVIFGTPSITFTRENFATLSVHSPPGSIILMDNSLSGLDLQSDWQFCDQINTLIVNSPTSSGALVYGCKFPYRIHHSEYQNFDWNSDCQFYDLLRDSVRQFFDLSCKTDRLFSYMFCNSDCQFSDWKSVALVHVQVTGAASWQLVHHVFNNNIWEVR